MLDSKTLRNITKKDLQRYLKSKNYKNVVGITRGYNGNSKDYTRIVDFLKKEIKDPNSKINSTDLNNFFFEKMFYDLNNYHFIYNIDKLLGHQGIVPLSKLKTVLTDTSIKLQADLLKASPSKKFDLLCTEVQTIIKNKIEYVTNIQFLIHIDEIESKRGPINFQSCIELNLENNFACFKLNQNLYESYVNKTIIIDELATLIQNKKGIFSPFNIELSSHNQVAVRRAIQRLFTELSQQAEKILMEETPDGMHEKINDFLDEISIPKNKTYVNQIIAVIYQDISKSFNKSLFNDGWAFRFVFKEGDNTRASSSIDDFEPVYGKQVYWNLKELMFKEKGTDFIEAGLLWDISNTGDAVSVKLEQKNNLISVLYYKKKYNLINRKEKERYVLRKIRAAL